MSGSAIVIIRGRLKTELRHWLTYSHSLRSDLILVYSRHAHPPT